MTATGSRIGRVDEIKTARGVAILNKSNLQGLTNTEDLEELS